MISCFLPPFDREKVNHDNFMNVELEMPEDEDIKRRGQLE